jgi:putative lipoic acid-binding regulatory protein
MKKFHQDRRPKISYPTKWTYTVIGVDRSALDTAIADVVEERSHKVSLSNLSSGGKYVSLKLELIVLDEKERLRIFDRLRGQAAVAFVL